MESTNGRTGCPSVFLPNNYKFGNIHVGNQSYGVRRLILSDTILTPIQAEALHVALIKAQQGVLISAWKTEVRFRG